MLQKILVSFALFFCLGATIYVYDDEGVSPESHQQVLYTLRAQVGEQHTIQTLSAAEVIEGAWTQSAVLFVMPGGADLPYAAKLNGRGNDVIKAYVHGGGFYLGLCAGGYYGSSYVEFDRGGLLEVLGTRELGFFPGHAIGPALAQYDYQNDSGARAGDIRVTLDGSEQNLFLFFNGGAYFRDAASFPDVTVLGWYETLGQAAIVKIKHGDGTVILSGVHFEYDEDLFCEDNFFIQKLLPSLKSTAVERKGLMKKVLNLLEIPIPPLKKGARGI